MNWLFLEQDVWINLSLVKLIISDPEGRYAYFTVPVNGERWDDMQRVYLSLDDFNAISERLCP